MNKPMAENTAYRFYLIERDLLDSASTQLSDNSKGILRWEISRLWRIRNAIKQDIEESIMKSWRVDDNV